MYGRRPCFVPAAIRLRPIRGVNFGKRFGVDEIMFTQGGKVPQQPGRSNLRRQLPHACGRLLSGGGYNIELTAAGGPGSVLLPQESVAAAKKPDGYIPVI
jgi:hypothetical protein